MLRRESIWVHWLAWKVARRVFLPGLRAVRGQVNGTLDAMGRLEAEMSAVPPPPPPPAASELRRARVQGDDLSAIPGLGRSAAIRLRLAGVNTYADLASRAPEDVARISGPASTRELAAEWIDAARLRTGAGVHVPTPEPARKAARRPGSIRLDTAD